MKSTGEVLGIGCNLQEALFKGLIAAGYKMHKKGGVFISVRDGDKHEVADIAKKFNYLGFKLYATEGTAKAISSAGIPVSIVKKIHESDDNPLSLLESGKIQYILSTSAKGRLPARDSVKIRRRACALNIPSVTSIDTANALADSLMSRYSESNTELVNINSLRMKKKTLNFIKMQGCGNDYIYFDCFEQEVVSPEYLSVSLSDRHFGIGGDGIVLICPSKVADAKMRMFNLDGSEGLMCGNAIRCVGKYLHDVRGVQKQNVTIETLSGIKSLKLFTRDNQVTGAEVNMGKAELDPAKIPVKLDGDKVVSRTVDIAGGSYDITCISMGNPHCVVFCGETDTLNLPEIGPEFENDPIFPERVNTEFIKVIDDHTLKMRVWERGSGETLACGTGACAAAAAAVENGFCPHDETIRVMLIGGDLYIRYTSDGTVYMKGSADIVYSGTIEI